MNEPKVHFLSSAFITIDRSYFSSYKILELIDLYISPVKNKIQGYTPYRKDMKTCGVRGFYKAYITGTYYLAFNIYEPDNSLNISFVPDNVISTINYFRTEKIHKTNLSIKTIETDFKIIVDIYKNSNLNKTLKNYELTK